MPKYEYQFVYYAGPVATPEDKVNALAKEGWRICNIIQSYRQTFDDGSWSSQEPRIILEREVVD